jgi:hypothetical protein
MTADEARRDRPASCESSRHQSRPATIMPLDTHARVAAVLHIVLACFSLMVLLAIAAVIGAFGALGPSWGVDREIATWVGGIGMMVVALFAFTAVTELVGAVMLLRGSDFGRVMTLVFSGLQLFNIPIGTAVGAYSLWALLRKVPDAAPPVAPARMDPMQPY